MRLDERPETFRDVVDEFPIGVYITDCERRIIFWNKAAERITGYMRHEVVGRFCRDKILMHCDQLGEFLGDSECPLTQCIRGGSPQKAKVYLDQKLGHRVRVEIRVVAVRNPHGSILGAVEVFDERNEATDQQTFQDTLAAYGCLDPVTNLPNHSYTRTHLVEALLEFIEHRLQVGVIVIQVEHLAEFESAYSREAMEEMLQVLARTIKDAVGPSAFPGRWQDQQFLAVLPASNVIASERVARHIITLVSRSAVPWWGEQLSAAVSVGWALVEMGDTLESLLQRAQRLQLGGVPPVQAQKQPVKEPSTAETNSVEI